MTAYATLPEMLAWRARETPGATAFRFGEAAPTFAQLWREIGGFATVLAEHGVGHGDRVLLALPNGPDFFAVFYGIQHAGATAVPIFPGSGAERVVDLARISSARAVVLGDDPEAAEGAAIRGPICAAGAELLTPAAAAGVRPAAGLPAPAPDDVAYIQYTSGSTGEPKGVQLSHKNLLVNIRQLVAGMEITAGDVFVSWLPVFHDMGLVLMTMVPFSLAAELVLLPTSLRDIRRWLEAIERHRGTFTAAPDFAWRLALRAAGRHDLSSLRVALNAAEPVRAKTLETFARTFRLESVMMPGYGLAEATVGVSMWPPGTEVAVDARGFPSVGPPFPEVELRILGEEGLVGPGEVGEILVRSPANTRGYLDDPAATAELFHEDGFARTGDLGYLDERGRLTIVGRRKNIIIHSGRNLAPSEIEQAADGPRAVRLAAAVGIDRGDDAGEQVYVFAEARGGDSVAKPERRELATEIVRRVHSRLGVRPGRVYLLRPRTLPLTANGKVRHQALKRAYLDGALRAGGAILFPDW
ncbi:MAG: AMP-binding protein [Thermoanaerobaculia bacterium]